MTKIYKAIKSIRRFSFPSFFVCVEDIGVTSRQRAPDHVVTVGAYGGGAHAGPQPGYKRTLHVGTKTSRGAMMNVKVFEACYSTPHGYCKFLDITLHRVCEYTFRCTLQSSSGFQGWSHWSTEARWILMTKNCTNCKSVRPKKILEE